MFVRNILGQSRRLAAALVAVGVLTSVARPHGQQPAAPAAPAPPAAPAAAPGVAAPPAATSLVFTGDAAIILFTVKAESAADFEAFFETLKVELAKSAKPEHKQMAAGWKIFKVLDGATPGQVLYATVLDPTAKAVNYDPIALVATLLPAAASKALTDKLVAATISVNRLNMQSLMTLSGM